MPNTREKLIDIVEAYADFLDWDTKEDMVDSIMEKCFATDNNVGCKWISVKDRLPDTAARVLVCKTWLGRVHKPEYGYYQDFPNQKGCWYVLTEEGYYPQREVTHWMPLPEPPKGE